MSDANDNPDPKLERMLRRWGAEEAADRAVIGGAPRPSPEAPAGKPPARGRAGWLIGLGALAVAAGVVAGFVILMGRLADARNDAKRQSLDACEFQGRVKGLELELRSAKKNAAFTETELQQRAGQFALDANDAKAEVEGLKRRLADARNESNSAQEKMRVALDQLAEQDRKVSDLVVRLNKAADDANLAGSLLAAAVGKKKLIEKALDEANAATTKAQAETEELKVRQAGLWNGFREAYLAAAAPGESGLKAAQTAARQSRLVERCGKVRQTVDAAQRPPMEKLEAVLTKLQLVEAGNFDSEGMFRSMLHASGIQKQLDDAIESRTLAPAARGVYFEARLVLSGADRAE